MSERYVSPFSWLAPSPSPLPQGERARERGIAFAGRYNELPGRCPKSLWSCGNAVSGRPFIVYGKTECHARDLCRGSGTVISANRVHQAEWGVCNSCRLKDCLHRAGGVDLGAQSPAAGSPHRAGCEDEWADRRQDPIDADNKAASAPFAHFPFIDFPLSPS